MALQFPISLGTSTIYGLPLEVTGRSERRQAERRAVKELVKEVFGPAAQLIHDEYGAPSIQGRKEYISVSHGAGYALLAVNTTRPIGIDIESSRESLKTIAGRFLSPEELVIYGSNMQLLLRAWTTKEAIFKVAGIPELTISDIHLPTSPDAPQTTHNHQTFNIHHLNINPNETTLTLVERI